MSDREKLSPPRAMGVEMSDMKPCPICDASMIKHCPNEKAALKYCGKSMMGELSRLRAELAAEKKRGEQLRKAMYDMHRASNAKGESE